MEIRQAGPEDAGWIRGRLIESWGSTRMVLRGELLDVRALEALVEADWRGLLHYRALAPGLGEIVTLAAFDRLKGIGTALVEAFADRARAAGHAAIVVVTTNDNLDALRFYQARGFILHEVRIGAVIDARKLKPEIPLTGEYDLPIRDEIELVRHLR